MIDAELVPSSLVKNLGPRFYGTVLGIDGPKIRIGGLSGIAHIGDRLTIARKGGAAVVAEALAVDRDAALAYAFESTEGVTAGARAQLQSAASTVRPSDSWFGHVIDWRGCLVGGTDQRHGDRPMKINAAPPRAVDRQAIGPRLATGMAPFDTFLPICRGQRIGIFAGSGVGKSSLLVDFAAGIQADVCVAALIGERSREVQGFLESARHAGALSKTVIVASTSDESALARRESARLALAIAEYFRSKGKHALLIFDSITRFAEAHREVALARGEPPSLHAYPPSTVGALASLVERAGPGVAGEGAITAIFSVLVAGSDMEEPVADMVRGLLDGHIVLDRAIAERGRFPAVNIRKSVSRSLPAAASEEENRLILESRTMLAAYENAELIIRAGLYAAGSDPVTDRAIALWPRLDDFVSRRRLATPKDSFDLLREILRSR